MKKSDAYKKGSASGKKWDGGGPGGPGSGPYGGGPRGLPRGLDNVRGIDHSKFSFSLCFHTLFIYFYFFPCQSFIIVIYFQVFFLLVGLAV